jgi:carbamoyl-phosphate synthase large subunit
MKSLNLLITGVSGDIGFGIGRILRENYPDSFLLGCDVDEDCPSDVFFDCFVKAPYADSENYIGFIIGIIKKYSINVVVPTSEAEINFFWKFKLVELLRKMNVAILILDETIVQCSLDKYKTYNFLKRNGLNCPETNLANNVNDLILSRFPKILKPRSGQGSKGIRIINSLDEIDSELQVKEYIVQELLSNDKNEYTCCVFGCSGKYRSIIFKRKLQNGFTVSGEVVENKAIEDYILSISKILQLEGSMNLQLRVTDRGPVLFEINPRFSSTVVFRDKLGFKDLIWAVQKATGGNVSTYLKPKEGTKFYRGITEYIL